VVGRTGVSVVLRQEQVQHFVVVKLLHQFSVRAGGGSVGLRLQDFTPHPTSRSNATAQTAFCS
jgi:hypothetical protein